MPAPRPTARLSHPPTIGMLTARLNGPTEINLWHGVADRARERNINLICFSGGIPYSQLQFESQKNVLYNIAGQPNVDGLLIWGNILSHTLDRSALETFCQRYAPLPIISMGMVLPAFPSIRFDMHAGMRKLLSHLIEQHGRRKIAFIRGLQVSQDAEDRYAAYLDTLKQYGLSFDPDLVIAGDFRRYAGTAAVKQLIDSGRTGFDALVSANDNMAIGAMQALQAHGIRIPEDVIMAGFDDIEETRAVAPSLTTVRAPWYILGSQSVDMVLSKLENEELPEQILLETELIPRQSCGCQQMVIEPHPAAGPGQAARKASRTKAAPPVSIHSARNDLLDQLNRDLADLSPLRGLEGGLVKEMAGAFYGGGVRQAGQTRRFCPEPGCGAGAKSVRHRYPRVAGCAEPNQIPAGGPVRDPGRARPGPQPARERLCGHRRNGPPAPAQPAPGGGRADQPPEPHRPDHVHHA